MSGLCRALPLSHGIPRVDDRRIASGIIFVIRNGLRWHDAPACFGPHNMICSRSIQWSRLVVFNRIFNNRRQCSQLSDGAAAQIVMDRPMAEAEGKEILGIYRGFQAAGCAPEEMGIGPVFAIPRLLDRAGLSVAHMGGCGKSTKRLRARACIAGMRLASGRDLQCQWRSDRRRPPIWHNRGAAGWSCPD